MKKNLCIALMAVLALLCAVALAESTNEYGIWEMKAFVDEFDMPTDNYFIVNEEVAFGKFSNSATNGSDLAIFLFCEEFSDTHEEYINIRLFEYARGSNQVKNSYSKSKYYDIIMMDNAGTKYNLSGCIPSKTADILVTGKDGQTIIDALKAGGTVRFAIVESDNALTKYTFTFEDVTGFDAIYTDWKNK